MSPITFLNQQFNPPTINHSWADDVTYLRTHEGWMYLAVVMDLYSRCIIGWSVSRRMTVELVEQALQMAITLRKPNKGVIFHSDRGSQYTSHKFSHLLKITVWSLQWAALENAVVERFFGSLKHEWLHTTLGDLTPINYEKLQNEVSGWAWPEYSCAACLNELTSVARQLNASSTELLMLV